jgi:hypothetical protein
LINKYEYECQLKKHKPWFDKVCLKLLDQGKLAKLHWLQDPSEINGDNLNNIRCETGGHFRNTEKEYLKDKNDDLATNSKKKTMDILLTLLHNLYWFC